MLQGDGGSTTTGEDGSLRHSSRRAASVESATKRGFVTLPAVSYVLRKTLGVRSYASSELLPWGGPEGGGGGREWLWGGGKVEKRLGPSEV